MSWLLLILGLIFIFLEFYLPGAILGSVGAILFIASLVLFALHTTSLVQGIAFFLFATAILVVMIWWIIKTIPKTRGSYSIYLRDDEEGFKASPYNQELIGKIATAGTDLRPGGYIIFQGERYPAMSQMGYVVKGTEVLVVGGEGEHLVVKPL